MCLCTCVCICVWCFLLALFSRFSFTNPNFYTHRIYCTTRLTTTILSRILSIFAHTLSHARSLSLFCPGSGAGDKLFSYYGTFLHPYHFSLLVLVSFTRKGGWLTCFCSVCSPCCGVLSFPFFPPPFATLHDVFRRERHIVLLHFHSLICAFRRQLFPFCCLRLCMCVCYSVFKRPVRDAGCPISDLSRSVAHQSSPARPPGPCLFIALVSIHKNKSGFYHAHNTPPPPSSPTHLVPTGFPREGGEMGEGYRRVRCLCCPNFSRQCVSFAVVACSDDRCYMISRVAFFTCVFQWERHMHFSVGWEWCVFCVVFVCLCMFHFFVLINS